MSAQASTKNQKGRPQTLRQRLENNFIVFVIGVAIVSGSFVFGTTEYFKQQQLGRKDEQLARKDEEHELALKQIEEKRRNELRLLKYLTVTDAVEQKKWLAYKNHIIIDPDDAPPASESLYEGTVFVQPQSETEYFRPPIEEPTFVTAERTKGKTLSEQELKEFQKEFGNSVPKHHVWIARNSLSVSNAGGHKVLFPYISVRRTTVKGVSYDQSIIAALTSRFGESVDIKQMQFDELFFGRRERIFVGAVRFLQHGVTANGKQYSNFYFNERYVIFPVRGQTAFVTVKEFFPGPNRVVSDDEFLEARKKWWLFFRVFRN